jgi:argininosuccinate lyase
MLTELFPRITFNKEKMRQRAAKGFSTVTELADLLVRKRNISFRQAHHIVGMVVNRLLDKSQGIEELSSAMINEASREIVGYDMDLRGDEVEKALDPSYNVVTREVEGGPGPRAMEKLISHQETDLVQKKEWLSGAREALEMARKVCEEASVSALGPL